MTLLLDLFVEMGAQHIAAESEALSAYHYVVQFLKRRRSTSYNT